MNSFTQTRTPCFAFLLGSAEILSHINNPPVETSLPAAKTAGSKKYPPMKKNQSPLGLRTLIVSAAFFLTIAPAAKAIDIPVLTWNDPAGNPRSDWLNVKTQYGAVGNGVADDTIAINNALRDASVNSQGAPVSSQTTVYLPAGTYKISNTLAWNTSGGVPVARYCAGVSLIGCGRNTIIKWAGPSDGTMFLSDAASRSRYVGITWDGSGVAAIGISHKSSATNMETRVTHSNEAFKSFKKAGIYSYGGNQVAGAFATAEVFVTNCFFWGCLNGGSAFGAMVGEVKANNYMWIFDGCEFRYCDTAVSAPLGKTVIVNSHFAHSTVTDIYSGSGYDQRVRRCTSVASKQFFSSLSGSTNAIGHIIQDCRIDGWTNATGAITLGNRGGNLVADCVFTNPPNTSAPIVLTHSAGPNYTAKLMVSNNYCPTIANLVSAQAGDGVQTIPNGAVVNVLTLPNTHFLNETTINDSAHILDVTGSSYGADKTGATDATAKIQQAIDAAKMANNGSIVYFPVGRYQITNSLTVSGGNYSIQGSGYCSQILWNGASGGTMMTVTTPQNITLSNFNLKTPGLTTTTKAMQVTSTGASNLTIDCVTSYGYNGNSQSWESHGNPGAPGVVLTGLPANSSVYIAQLNSPLTVDNCGPAKILVKHQYDGPLKVKGATALKTGYLEFITKEECADQNFLSTTPWAVDVDDNQNVSIADYYGEANNGELRVRRGAATGTVPGVVAIQGIKTEGEVQPMMSFENFLGRVLYGFSWFKNATGSPFNLTQTGANACDIAILGNIFEAPAPVFNAGTGGNWIRLQNIDNSLLGSASFLPDVTPANYLDKVAVGLDDIRKVGKDDLSARYGILNPVVDSGVDLDPVNPNPTTGLGYAPPSPWSTTGAGAYGSGIRNVTVANGGSPFASTNFGSAVRAGGQSILVVDNTGSATGTRLDFAQTFTALKASQAGIFTFDFRMNAAGTGNDLRIRPFANGIAGCNIHLYLNTIFAVIGGTDTSLGTLTNGTWYRVQVVMGAPASPGTAKLYLTPWTGSGPGTTTSYTIDGIGASQSAGFSRIGLNTATPGQGVNINVDNMILQTGEDLAAAP
ncbi:MAG: glycosyl hydrolase family 28-related protein [Terrimicrobiaceae bacterium]|nr:glycosyl hydrolase family 28-related protein [Terrimicrobiaceae bacterium]